MIYLRVSFLQRTETVVGELVVANNQPGVLSRYVRVLASPFYSHTHTQCYHVTVVRDSSQKTDALLPCVYLSVCMYMSVCLPPLSG